jgi:hypothetical protein
VACYVSSGGFLFNLCGGSSPETGFSWKFGAEAVTRATQAIMSSSTERPRKGPEESSTSDTVPNLTLEDTTRQFMRGVSPSTSDRKVGVNPYDTFPNPATSTGMHATRDLRRLSEWIRQKRQSEQLKLENRETEPNKPRR